MKNRKKIRGVLALAFASAAVVLATFACTNPVLGVLTEMTAKSFGLTGKWGNPAYGTAGFFPKSVSIVINADGSLTYKDSFGFTLSGTYTIASTSISGNTRTYSIDVLAGSPAPTIHYYTLAKLTGASTLEFQVTTAPPYPTSFNPFDYYGYASLSAQ